MATVPKKKMFSVLENNPAVMSQLATTLGLSQDLTFYDIFSLTEPDLLAFIPRPAHALLAIIPLTPTWHAARIAEDATVEASYNGSSPSEPLWFKQTIGHACGSIGLIHCLLNGYATSFIQPGSELARLREEATPLQMNARAQLLYDSEPFERAHASVAQAGDTPVPELEAMDRLGQHFVAFVKDAEGRFWELEGSRKGPLLRGVLNEDEDVLSERALGWGIGRIMQREMEAGGGDLRFSCIALAARE